MMNESYSIIWSKNTNPVVQSSLAYSEKGVIDANNKRRGKVWPRETRLWGGFLSVY